MKKQQIAIGSLLCIVLIIAVIIGKRQPSEEKKVEATRFVLGTFVSVEIFGTEDESIVEEAFQVIEDIEAKMSLTKNNTELAHINEMAGKKPVKVSEDTLYVVKESIKLSEISKEHNLFDISIEPVNELWAIGTKKQRVPTKKEIETHIPFVDASRIIVDEEEKTVYIEEGMKINVGATAKGYATNKVVDYLKRQGIKKAIINVGGNVYVHGKKSKDTPDYGIGIRNPFGKASEYHAVVKAHDISAVTSGVYERYFEEDGKMYHHILNKKTGYPVANELTSISILSTDSFLADGLSTVVFTMGAKEGYKFVENYENVEGIFITKEKDVYITSGLKEKYSIIDTEFTLCSPESLLEE